EYRQHQLWTDYFGERQQKCCDTLAGGVLTMVRWTPARRLAALMTIAALCPAFAQKNLSLPKVGDHTLGEDYFLANYTQLLEHWNKVAKGPDRLKLVEYGKTAEGRPMVVAIITSPANHKNLARYKTISQRLARAEGLTDEQAHQLAAEGKA